MTTIIHEFESEVTKATSVIVAASHKAALALLDEAFFQQRRKYQAPKGETERRPVGTHSQTHERRSPEDIDALVNHVMKELWTTPGQTITMLAARIGVVAKELRNPIRRLKSQGKLKTAGVNQFTKYFPVPVPSGSQEQGR